MARSTDETIIESLGLEVTSNAQGAVNGLDALTATLSKLKSVTKGGLGLTAVIKQLKNAGDAAKDVDSKAVSNLNGLAHAVQTLSSISANLKIPPSLGDKILNLGYKADLLNNYDFTKLHELADGVKALDSVSGINLPSIRGRINPILSTGAVQPIDISQGVAVSEGATSEITQIKDACENATAAASELKGKIADAGSSTEIAGQVKRELSETTSLLDRIKAKFISLKGIGTSELEDTEKSVNRFTDSLRRGTAKASQFFSSLKRIAMYRAIRAVLSTITKSLKEGIGNVYQYSKLIDGDFAASMDRLATGALYLKNSLGAMFSPLIETAIPWIDTVIDKIVEATNAFNRFVAFLSGASSWTKAVRYPIEYAEAAGSAKDAVDELKKTILGIDELNLMADNSKISAGGSSSDLDYSQMFEQVEIGEEYRAKWQWLKDIVDDIKAIWNGMTDLEKAATLVGGAIALWAVPKLLMTGIETLFKSLGSLGDEATKVAMGLTLVVSGIALGFHAGYDMGKNGLSWKNTIETAVAGIAAVAGFTLLTGSLAAGLAIGIPLTLTALCVGIYLGEKAKLKEQYENSEVAKELDRIHDELAASWEITKQIRLNIQTRYEQYDSITADFQAYRDLIEKAFDLSEVENKTQYEVDLLKGYIKTINELNLDGIQLEYDETTQTIKQTREEVEKTIQALENQAKMEAAYSFLVDAYRDQYTAQQEYRRCLEENKKALDIYNEQQAKLDELNTEYNEVSQKLRDRTAEFAKSGTRNIVGNMPSEIKELQDKAKDLADEIKLTTLAVEDAEKELGYSLGPIGEAKRAVDESKASIEFFETELATMGQTAKSVSGTVADEFDDMYSDVKKSLNGFSTEANGTKTKVTNEFGDMSRQARTYIGEISNTLSGLSSTAGTAANGIQIAFSPLFSVFDSLLQRTRDLRSNMSTLSDFSNTYPSMFASGSSSTWGRTGGTFGVPGFADGGMPTTGQLFIAREAGAELVGSIGNKTAVMNNDQIVESVSRGVADANSETNALLREEVSILKKLLEKDFGSGGSISVNDIVNGIARKNRRDGTTVVPVG